MAIIEAFRGIHYDLTSGDVDLGKLACPPYDVLSSKRRQVFADRDDANFVRVEVPAGGEDRYAEAAAVWNRWLTDGTVREDATPRFYLYRQNFAATVGGVDSRFTRTGLLASVDARALGRGILPYESTQEAPKEDRYRLAMAARAQFSAVPLLYRDEDGSVASLLAPHSAAAPLARFLDDDSVEHELYEITSAPDIAALTAVFQDKICLLADGQNRFEALARAWREIDFQNAAPRHGVLALLVADRDPGLIVRPVHRIYRGLPLTLEDLRARLETRFAIETFPWAGVDAAESWLLNERVSYHAFLLHWKGAAEALLLKAPRESFGVFPGHSAAWSRLDVAVLTRVIQEEVLGVEEEAGTDGGAVVPVYDSQRLPHLLDRAADSQFAIMMNPTSADEIAAMARSEDRLPPRSIDVAPKIWSGLVSLRLPA